LHASIIASAVAAVDCLVYPNVAANKMPHAAMLFAINLSCLSHASPPIDCHF